VTTFRLFVNPQTPESIIRVRVSLSESRSVQSLMEGLYMDEDLKLMSRNIC
jgi:hypothetical protein